MKKFFGIGKKKKSGPSPSPSETGSVLSVGYELKDKELSKLHRAASAGDAPKIRQLLPKQDINQLDKENRTPLHLACANGHLDAVKLLVESKAKLNLCDNDSRTPLIKSIQCQHEHCATALLEHNADPNIVDVNGNSAFHLAALIPSLTIANQLLEHGANINAVNKEGCTPLVLAATENHQEMVEFLIKEGADVNSKDKNGRTSLMVAAGNGQISLVKYLLQNNVDIFVKDETGWTADDHAVMNGHHACSHLIIEHGSKNKRSSLYGGVKKGTSVFSSPDRVVEGGFTLGSPAIDKEVLIGTDDLSRGDSESHVSGKTDSWPSSDEDDLDFSPKKTSKPSLTQLLSSKRNVNESGSFTAAQPKRFAIQSKSDSEEDSFHDSEDEDANTPSSPKPIPEIHSFPQPVIFTAGSFPKPPQLASASLHSINKSEQTVNDQEEVEVNDQEEVEVEEDNEEECEEGNDQCEEDNEESEALDDGEEDEECGSDDDQSEGDQEESEALADEEEQCGEDDEEEAQCEEDEDSFDDEDREQCPEIKNDGDVGDSLDDGEEHSNGNEVVGNLDPGERDYRPSNGIAESDCKANVGSSHCDGCLDTPEVEQNAQYTPDCNDVPVSLIFGLPENSEENGTSTEHEAGSLTTCIRTDQNIEVTSTAEGQDKDDMHVKSFSSDESEEDNEDSESSEHSFTANTASQAKVQASGDVAGRKVALMSELGLEDDDVESPWDSESASDSPRKHSTSDMPTPAAPVHMQCISEESHEDMYYRPCFLKHSRSCKMQDEDWLYRQSAVSEKSTAPESNKKTVLQMNNGSSATSVSKVNERNSKSDLMADLGLDDADDIEDASDWDSTSHSLKYSSHTPRGVAQSHHKLNESTPPQTLLDSASTKATTILPPMPLSSVQEDDNEDNVQLKKDIQSKSKDISQDSHNNKNGLLNGKTLKDQNYLKNEHMLMTSNFKMNPEPINQKGVSQQSLENLPDVQNADENQEFFDSELPWEEKYERMWVDHEKKFVKSHFKDITAELKQKFGEISKMKKKSPSKTSKSQEEDISPSSLDLEKHLGQGARTSTIVMYPVSVDKDDKSLGNSESTDWSEDTKSKLQERFVVSPIHGEKGSNTVNLQEKEKQPFTLGVSNFPTKNNSGHTSPLPTKGIGKSLLSTDFEKFGNALSQANDKVDCVNMKESDVQHFKSYNEKVKDSRHLPLEEHTPQLLSYDMPNKHLDNQLEQDMRRFKNEVGVLQLEFLNLTRERSQLQKEVEREKANVTRQLELEKVKGSTDNECELQAESNVQPKSNSSSHEEKNVRLPVKSGQKQDDLKKIFKQRCTENGDMLEGFDDSTLSETSQKPGKRATTKRLDENSKDNDDDMDEFSQLSDSVSEEYEVPTSSFRNAMLLIEQFNLEGQDSVNVLKIQNIIHEYERVIEKEHRRHALLAQEVKKLREERKELQQMTEKNRELKSLLEYNKVDWDSDVSGLRSSLKQEEEKRKSAEMLHDMSKDQFRRKEEQCRREIEDKQQLELTLRNLELEMRSLRNSMKQVEEERNESQRLYTQEHSARLLQEEALNNLKRRNEEEESRKLLTRSVLSEPSETNVKVKELTQKNMTLQEEIHVHKQELEQARSRYQEEESRYLDENEALKEKIDDLRKDLRVNEETLTQTVIQYNGQLNALKTETNMLCSKLEHETQSKERLETELESVRSRLNSALQDLERSQISKTDAERTLQRERDDWLRSKDKFSHDLSGLRESHNNLSQQLSRAEAKSNGLENDLHRTGLSLQEKTLLLESSQRDLKEAQSRIKDLDQSLQVEKDQTNKSSIKQEIMHERLAQITSENMQLHLQLEDAQNKGVIKEKVVSDVQDRFTDMYSKLRADAERQVQIVEERNKDLINKSNEQREQIYKLETEKVERESSIRQLQQEFADALKKLSMSEASLEVITRYRNDLEEEKQHLHKELEKFRTKVQDVEEQFLQSERSNHQLKNLLDDKEREVIAAFQKVQALSSAAAGSETSIKQLEEHIQKLEIENAKIEATAKQQSVQIETLQKELQESITIRSRLEDLVTGLQTSKIGMEEKMNQQVQKQTVLSQSAQDSQNLWEEELKSRSRLGVRLAEFERSNADLAGQVENEKKKVRKLLDQKKSMEERFDQEIKRNNNLQHEVSGFKKHLKTTRKKLKEFENSEKQPIHIKEGSYRSNHEKDNEVLKLKEKIEELSAHLDRESRKYIQLEASNRDLHEQLSSMKTLHRNHERLERSKRQLEEEVSELRRHISSSKMDQSYMEQYKREIDERSRQELRQKLEEVNIFLQAQAASKDKLEQLRAENDSTLKNQLEHRIQDLESELNKVKNIQEENMSQKDSTLTELNRIKDMYAEEQKTRKSLASKLERANERLAEANAKLLNERQRSKSLFASSFLNGSLNGNPLLDTSPLGGLGSSPALSRSLGIGGSFLNPVGSSFTNEMGAYFVKMQQELEKNITKELDQANAELDTGCARVSPVGSTAGSMRNLSNDQDLVSQARQQYLEVLNKNYKI
ncbi:PREDICTED: ankyrin repeat domain-containing protein 26-like [Nanorana parkeri]|uniref:ankyrin repeat domain-containing protein 26-like n=1 Tax=Nanorana parkeri TaxID=125878 RepID=UPI0008544B92|nr:PREDICTED: ankyrin repeat domain-containing protein 26-like [Nanorana parkeri]